MAEKQIPVCTSCGSVHILFDAYCVFNPETQEYEHNSEHGNPVCEGKCGGPCSVEWVDFTAEIKERWDNRYDDSAAVERDP